MNPPVAPTAIEDFRCIVTGRLGLSLDAVPADTIEDLLADRVAASGGSHAAYLASLAGVGWLREVGGLAAALTVPETYFFRHVEQLNALAEVVVPALVRARRADRKLRFLSMGCATGEEAYTLSMVIRDALPGPGWDVSIIGVDANPVVLRRAERGRYAEWSLRATPAPLRQRWFRPDGGSTRVDEEIRRTVRFVEGNLANADPGWWLPGGYDAIFCRNVIMYLTPHAAREAVERLTAAIAPDGFLFLGHAEASYGRSPGLDLRHTHDTFYYQRARPGGGVQPDGAAGVGPAVTVAGSAWTDAPAASFARAAAAPPVRSGRAAAPPVRSGRAAAPARTPTCDRVLDLLRRERFEDALAEVERLPFDAGSDALLLRAVLLAQLGHLDRAEETCRRLLDADGLDAGAQFLLAVCREGAGDGLAAAAHARTAAYLDPGFAMPRLRLGLLAKEKGDLVTARCEFTAALALLPGEDAQRLLYFGGGFARTALIEFCRAELRTCASAA